MGNEEDVTIIGATNFRGEARGFGILTEDRRRHVYIIGKTGVGKTTLMEGMIRQDIQNGKGVALVDPHGDLAESLLDEVPPERINDVIYFDPSDVNYPVGFNVLEAVDPQYKYLIASGLIGSLKKIWADSWGPRLEYILRNTILALLDYPSSTMLGILRMLGDNAYRKKVVEKIQDPVVKSFWTNEFSNYNERFRAEAISPIQNKVGQFLTSSIIRNIVAQPKSTIDMSSIMDNKKILLMNLSKGKIGEDNSSLLGAMLISRLQLAAMDRAKIPEEERVDFYLYVDEFQNFATESFATILSEARKYRLNLTIAHQYITQMEEETVRDAVFGNAGTIICFRVGAVDGEFLEKEMAPLFTETDLVNLNKYNAYIKLMIDGITSKPFSMQTIPPGTKPFGKKETIISVSRERYGRARDQVEDKIARWSGVVFNATAENENKHDKKPSGQKDNRQGDNRQRDHRQGDLRQKNKQNFPPHDTAKNELGDIIPGKQGEEITDLASLLKPKGTQVKCDLCDKQTDVPFEPKEGKKVYCRNCYKKIKEEKATKNNLDENAQQLNITDKEPDSFAGPKAPQINN
jgi:CxxC-x17-CxxC domain-containing protein